MSTELDRVKAKLYTLQTTKGNLRYSTEALNQVYTELDRLGVGLISIGMIRRLQETLAQALETAIGEQEAYIKILEQRGGDNESTIPL